MPKNLEAKVGILLQDIEKFSTHDKIQAITRLLETELGYIQSQHNLNFATLQQVATGASVIARELPSNLHIDGKKLTDYPDNFRSLCYILATYQYFRAQNLTSVLVGVKDNGVI